MAKKVTITGLLEWAFKEELCKVGAGGGGSMVATSSWDMMNGFAELGTLIDKSPNQYGVIPNFIGDSWPAHDAVLVGDAVRALVGIGFELPAGWNPLAGFEDPFGLVEIEVERVVQEMRLKPDTLTGKHAAAIVTGCAILSRGPDWRCDAPEFRLVSANGKPRWFIHRTKKDAFGRKYAYEDDGFDRVKQRPKPKAYRKYELKASLRGAIVSRLEWQVWQDALLHLGESLAGRLEAHELLPFVPNRTPWFIHKNVDHIENA
jgi:hypothetical protein